MPLRRGLPSNVFSFYRLIKLRFIAVKIKYYVIKMNVLGQDERKVGAQVPGPQEEALNIAHLYRVGHMAGCILQFPKSRTACSKNCHQIGPAWTDKSSFHVAPLSSMFAGINLFLRFHAFSLFLIIPLLLSGLGLALSFYFSLSFLDFVGLSHLNEMNEWAGGSFGPELGSGCTLPAQNVSPN